MNKPVNLALLLRQDCRTPDAKARVEELAAQLGVELTTSGLASISGKVSTEDFARLFGRAPTPQAPRAPQARDFGAPGGYHTETELTVPAELREFVETIAIVPPARRLY